MNDRLTSYSFNLFKGGIKIKKPTQVITLADTLALIAGPAYELATRELRSLEPDLRKVFKQDLDYVTFSGTFAPTRLVGNLNQHSGLLCLDFDHVANLFETRLQLQADPYTLALFTSPSGDGLKLIIEADQLGVETGHAWTDRHKAIFADLAFYFRQTYGLEVDASGSDVSRACFLVHDPQVFVNPDATAYTSKGLATRQPPKPRTEAQQVKDASDVYKHVLAVVERIEAAQIDITGDYSSEWLLIGFCMSTLGEPGRDLLHRISQFNPKYDQTDTDEKFDNAVATCRFTTPWKFFEIAKDYGVDVSKPKREKPSTKNVGVEPVSQAKPTEKQAKASDTAAAKEPKTAVYDFDTNGTVTYDRAEHQIRVKSGKSGYNTVADNFLIYVKYVTEDENENLTWVLEIKPEEGDSIFVEVPHEDFNSASRLKRIISGKQFALKISDSELSELHAYLFTRTQFSRAIKITRYGYHAPSGVFFFANKALNGQLLTPDEFGMVSTLKDNRPLHLSMPVNNKHKAHRFTLTDHQVSVNEFFQTYAEAHGYENAMIPFCFYMMALYRDLALKHKNFSPILYLKGGAGTGKSSMVRVLTAAFGKKQEGVNLKSKNTETALSKLMSQASNTIIWFDEYHNDITCEGLLQAAYDNDGYHLSKAGSVGTNETDSIDIYSALALTSNYLPENPIFFSRCVFVAITSQDKTDQQVVAFNQLEEWQEEGLGCLTLELLQYRELIEKEYAYGFDHLLKKLKAEFKGEKVPERFFTNMAQLMTVGLILHSAGKIALTEFTTVADIVDEFVRIGAATIRRQFRIMSEKTALSEFFEIIQQLYDQYQIHEEIHFDFKVIGQTSTIELWFPQLYNLYAQHYRRINMKAPADRDQLQSEIAAFEEQPDWDAVKKQIRFMNDGEGRSSAKSIPRPNSCTMDYHKLREKFGINLESRKQRNP